MPRRKVRAITIPKPTQGGIPSGSLNSIASQRAPRESHVSQLSQLQQKTKGGHISKSYGTGSGIHSAARSPRLTRDTLKQKHLFGEQETRIVDGSPNYTDDEEEYGDSGPADNISDGGHTSMDEYDEDAEGRTDYALRTERQRAFEKKAIKLVNNPTDCIGPLTRPVGTLKGPDDTSRRRGNIKTVTVAERLPESRSVEIFGNHIRPIVDRASKTVIRYTLFENPFPVPCDISKCIDDAWKEALNFTGITFADCDPACRRQLRSQYWRTKSHLVFEGKQDIEYLFKLDDKDPEKIKHDVNWLLQDDRFICANHEAKKLRFLAPQIPELIYRKYFKGSRMLGQTDTKFISYISKEFICLVATVLHYCLQAWSSGSFVDLGRFRGIGPKAVWLRQLSTWGNLSQSLQSELLKTITNLVNKKRQGEVVNSKMESTSGFFDDEELMREELKRLQEDVKTLEDKRQEQEIPASDDWEYYESSISQLQMSEPGTPQPMTL